MLTAATALMLSRDGLTAGTWFAVAGVALAVAALLPAGLFTDPVATRSWGDLVHLGATTPDAKPTLFGTVSIAASDKSAPTGRTAPFRAAVGVGSIRMSANEGESVTFRVHVGLGEVRLLVPDGWEWDTGGQTSIASSPSDFGTPPRVKPLAWIPLTAGPNETIVVRTPAAAAGVTGFVADLELGIGTVTLTETPTTIPDAAAEAATSESSRAHDHPGGAELMRGSTITLGLITLSIGMAAVATGFGAHLDLIGLAAGTVGLVGSVLLVLALIPVRDMPAETARDGRAVAPAQDTAVWVDTPAPIPGE